MKQTPISILGIADRLVWNHSKSGQYTVNSGYKWAKALDKRLRGDEGTSSDTAERDAKLWKEIWNLNVKKKIQHFIWRACHDRIPVGTSLKKKGMMIDDVCKQCGEAKETVEHLFFFCPRARITWKLAPVHWEGLEHSTFSFKEWWRELGMARRGNGLDERQELTAYIMWHMWKARNQWQFNSELWPEPEIIQRAWKEWFEFKTVQHNLKQE